MSKLEKEAREAMLHERERVKRPTMTKRGPRKTRPRAALMEKIAKTLEHQGDKRGSATRGWSALKPTGQSTERAQLWHKCGQRCFLGQPHRDARGQMIYPYPICSRCTSNKTCSCAIESRGVEAAYRRAKSVAARFRNRGDATRAKYHEAIANKANALRRGGAGAMLANKDQKGGPVISQFLFEPMPMTASIAVSQTVTDAKRTGGDSVDAYGRGMGFTSESECKAAHPGSGCELWGFLYYPRCKHGFHPSGCCICSRSGGENKAAGSKTGGDGAMGEAYGRGAGFTSESECRSAHPGRGCERWGLLYYPRCAHGYHPSGCCLCSRN